MATNKWLDRTQPQTLYIAVILRYVTAPFDLLGGLAAWRFPLGLLIIAGLAGVCRSGRCVVHLHVPATPAKHLLTWTEGEAHAIAQQRLAEGLELYRRLPATVDGEVGDANPVRAVVDVVVRGEQFDLAIV